MSQPADVQTSVSDWAVLAVAVVLALVGTTVAGFIVVAVARWTIRNALG